MKNLLILAFAGLGERHNVGAPTFWKTVEGFIAAGWKVWIVDVGTKEDTPLGERDYGDGLYIIRFNPPFLKETRIREIGCFFSLANTVWITRKLRSEAERLIGEKGLTGENTVVYAQEVYSVCAAKKISEKYHMPIVTRFYGTVMCDKPYSMYLRIRDYPHFQALRTEADVVIMTNDGTKGNEVLKRVHNPSKKQFFWRNGVDYPKGTDIIPAEMQERLKGKPMIMTLCRLNLWKHVDRAISALPAVLKTCPDTMLVVCGYGPEREKLETQAREANVAEHVIFTGKIEHELAFAYMKETDVFLSLYDLSNLGNPLFEAMRCGKPIITLDVGATNTVVEDGVNGVLLPADGLSRLPEEICCLLSDEDERKRLGEGAKRFADENFWTWDERIAAEIREVTALLPPERD